MKLNFRSKILLLLAVMVVAVFFRFYQLDKIPPGLYPDVAINGNDALQSLQTGDYKLFYPENNGREGLIMWLDALSIYLFGINVLALKIPAALVGTLTVWGIYLLARQLFDRKKEAAALLSAFFCATSFWHVNFSRIGFRAILIPFCLVFSFYFLWRTFKEKKIWLAIMSGIFFGLGFYTYISFRLAIPLLFCALGLWLIPYFKQKNIGQFVKLSTAMLLATFFVALPIGVYFLRHPADFFGRAAQTSILIAKNPLFELGKSLVLHLGMFNIYGDGNWRHNFAGAPELNLLVGIAFLAGLFVLLKSNLNSSSKLSKFDSNNIFLFLLLWLAFMLLPGVLTSEGIPHALRTIGVIPAVMIISAVGTVAVYDWLKPRLSKIMLGAITVVFIVAVIAQGYWQYFVAWAQNPNVQGAFTTRYVNVANLAVSFPADYQTVIIVNENGVPVPYPNGIPMPAQTVIFAETAHCYESGCLIGKTWYSPHSTYLKPEQLDQIVPGRKTVIIPMKDDSAIFGKLSQMFPQGQIKQKNNIRCLEIIKN